MDVGGFRQSLSWTGFCCSFLNNRQIEGRFSSAPLTLSGNANFFYCCLTCGETFMMLGWISDPFVCVSVLDSDLFSIWAMLTVLGSFLATGGFMKHKQWTASNNFITAWPLKTLEKKKHYFRAAYISDKSLKEPTLKYTFCCIVWLDDNRQMMMQ